MIVNVTQCHWNCIYSIGHMSLPISGLSGTVSRYYYHIYIYSSRDVAMVTDLWHVSCKISTPVFILCAGIQRQHHCCFNIDESMIPLRLIKIS